MLGRVIEVAEYIEKYDVWVTVVRMPLCVKGFCRRKLDDDCVVVNADLSDEAQRAAIEHEAEHFRRGDIDSESPVGDIEREVAK